MASIKVLLICLACGLSSTPTSQLKTFGADSLPVEVTYETYFYLSANKFTEPLPLGAMSESDLEAAAGPTAAEEVTAGIHAHAMHLYGVFTYHERPTDFYTFSGALKSGFTTQLRRIAYDKKQKSYKFSYHFRGEGQFVRGLLDGRKKATIEFLLPNNPYTIYSDIMAKTHAKGPKGKKVNPCTSSYDNSEEAFYYYWSLDWGKDCPKRKLQALTHRVKAQFKALTEERRTYPEYHRLYANKTKDRPLIIDIVHSFDEKPKDPKDLGRLSYQWDVERFSELGWEALPSKKWQRRWRVATDRYEAEIRVSLIDSESKAFDRYVRSAMKEADIFMYSGHSSDGYYFDIERLYGSDTALNRLRRYQIFFLNSCTSYSFFHSSFFKAKQNKRDPEGTKNLDVIANVIGAPFLLGQIPYSHNYLLTMSLLGMNVEGELYSTWRSWQTILRELTAAVELDDSALTVVFGDEDNPRNQHLFGPTPLYWIDAESVTP